MDKCDEKVFTLLFTDIEGSTRLWEQHSKIMSISLERHDHLVRRCIEEAGGEVFKTVGDAFCAAFDAPDAALLACVDVQRVLKAEPWPEETPIVVRAALYTGRAQVRSGDYFGASLNRCARLLGLAHGRQSLASDTTRDALLDCLPSGCGFLDLHYQELRDLGGAMRVFQVLHQDLPSDFPSIGRATSVPNNVPLRRSSFVGHQQACESLGAALTERRLISLVGIGGSGKTRLALEVAARVMSDHPDGVWFVELAGLEHGEMIIPTIAHTLRLREEPGRSLQQTLENHLTASKMLIVLDNCEHLIEACATEIAALGGRFPDLTILVTSREPLRIEGEWVEDVPQLSIAPEAEIESLEREPASLMRYDSIRLFVERAQAVKNRFALAPTNAGAVARIVAKLDGIPLAIELAASRINHLSVAQIEQRLERRFGLLRSRERDRAARHRTLDAMLDWSFELLEPGEQDLFTRLAVFRGGWTLDDAEAICAYDGLDSLRVLDGLDALVSKSLAFTIESHDVLRFGFLETVRGYSAERFMSRSDANALQRRHVERFEAVLRDWPDGVAHQSQQEWLLQIETEHDNYRAAIAYCRADDELVEAELSIAAALQPFWLTRGYLTEGRQHLCAAIERASVSGPRSGLARAMRADARLAFVTGDLDQARERNAGALELFRERGDAEGEADSLRGLAVIASRQGDYSAARPLLNQALDIASFNQLQGVQADVRTALGNLCFYQSDLEAAEEHYARALSLLQDRVDARVTANAIHNLAVAVASRGDVERASGLLDRSLELARSQHNERLIAYVLRNRAEMSQWQGKMDEASHDMKEALDLARKLRDRRSILFCLGSLGNLAIECSELDDARAWLQEARAGARQLGDRSVEAESLAGLGRLALNGGESGEALALFQASLKLRLILGVREGIAVAFEDWAIAAVSLDRAEPAARALAAAAALRAGEGAAQPADPERVAEASTEARRRLGDDEFERAWSKGSASSPSAVFAAITEIDSGESSERSKLG